MNFFAIGLVWLALMVGLYDINESLKLIHQALRDTNHAPLVVTNVVTVTQECHRSHWPEPGQSTPLPFTPSPSWFTNHYYTATTQYQNVVGSNDTVTVHMKDAASGEWISFPLFKKAVTNDAGDVEK